MRSATVLAIAGVLAIVGQATAVPIYSTFGPGNSYDIFVYDIGRPGYNWDRGEQWSFGETKPYTLDSVELAVRHMYVDCAPVGPDQLQVLLMTDAGGQPGAIIETWTFVDQMGIDPSILVGNSTLHPVLDPYTNYWLVASTPDDGTWAGWAKSLPAVLGTHGRKLGSDPWEIYTNITQGAFRINATPREVPPPVPAPGALILSGIGMMLVGYLRKREML